MSRGKPLKARAASLSAGFYLPAAGRSGNGRRTPKYRNLLMTLAKTDRRADDRARACARRKPKSKPKPKECRVAIRVRVKPSVKTMAERLAQKDARSMADWLECLIAAEAAWRRAAKKRI
jgi:hypothetical protein